MIGGDRTKGIVETAGVYGLSPLVFPARSGDRGGPERYQALWVLQGCGLIACCCSSRGPTLLFCETKGGQVVACPRVLRKGVCLEGPDALVVLARIHRCDAVLALEQRVRGMGARRRSGSDSNKWGRWRSAVVVRGANADHTAVALGEIGGTACSRRPPRTGLARVCGDLRLAGGWVSRRRRRQAGNGIACSRARARLNWVSQGQRRGRCRVRRRAERVSRPAREKKRRLSVLVVAIRSPRPMRAVQRAKFVGHHLYRQPGAVGGEAPRRHVGSA